LLTVADVRALIPRGLTRFTPSPCTPGPAPHGAYPSLDAPPRRDAREGPLSLSPRARREHGAALPVAHGVRARNAHRRGDRARRRSHPDVRLSRGSARSPRPPGRAAAPGAGRRGTSAPRDSPHHQRLLRGLRAARDVHACAAGRAAPSGPRRSRHRGRPPRGVAADAAGPGGRRRHPGPRRAPERHRWCASRHAEVRPRCRVGPLPLPRPRAGRTPPPRSVALARPWPPPSPPPPSLMQGLGMGLVGASLVSTTMVLALPW